MMTIFQQAIVDYVPVATHAIMRGLVIFIIALGIVYVLGRMLGLAENYRTKNAVALIAVIALSYWSVHIYDMGLISHSHEIYWRTLSYISLATIFYVLAGFDLYDRFNTWCDNRFGKPKNKKLKK